MTDHERVLVGLFSAGDDHRADEVSLLEIVEMLYRLGAEHRAQVHGDRTLVNA
jgi:hypothetical protein